MAGGKAAGLRCIQLDEADRCRLFGDPRRPAVCASLQPSAEMCGADRATGDAVSRSTLERD